MVRNVITLREEPRMADEADADHVLRSRIWKEEAEPDDPFATRAAYCHGFDVYGGMLGTARWVDMLYVLLRGEPPSERQSRLLESLAVALANPGPRDPMVHAAMCGGVGGSHSASCLMAALAVGAGQLGGGREVFVAMQGWEACGTDLPAWLKWLSAPPDATFLSWPIAEHPAGSTLAAPARPPCRCVRPCPAWRLCALVSSLPALPRPANRVGPPRHLPQSGDPTLPRPTERTIPGMQPNPLEIAAAQRPQFRQSCS